MYNNFHGFMGSSPFFGLGFGLFALTSLILIVLALGVIALKGYALWTAAKRNEKGWFIALLLINTMGILELVYLYVIAEKWRSSNAPHSKHPHEHTHKK